MNIFLRAKHWQLFLVIFLLPMSFEIILFISVIKNIVLGQTTVGGLNNLKFFPSIFIPFYGIFFAWLWAVAIGLQDNISDYIKMKINKFKMFFFSR